jgi:cyclopropane-fatty-acyl-phospholipid synthase
MNETRAFAEAWADPTSWYQKIVLSLLFRMDKGRLNLTLPNGDRLTLGARDFESNPTAQASIQILSSEFFERCVLYGDIGFGEAYTDGLWDTDNLTQVIHWMILNTEHNPGISGSKTSNAFFGLLKGVNRLRHLGKDNSRSGSQRNISEHYDLSNDLFATFLDSSMTYSSGDFSRGAQTLEAAQIAKFDRLAESIQIKPTDHVLEIGGGWGAFAIHLATKYGCKVTTLTVSNEQFEMMNERISQRQLADRVTVLFQDYREVAGQFDKIVSVEMLEAVGHRHLPRFFEVAERVLKPNGLMGVQVITSADSRYELLKNAVDWTQKHIFPGSLIPSIAALTDAARSTSEFQIFSLFDLGTSYARTLAEWRSKFNANLDRVKELGFDQSFVRAWNYYFSYCEAGFAARHISVVQIVFTRPNNIEIA